MRVQNVLRRQYALPAEHGAWVFLLSPLLIGLFAGGKFNQASFFLVMAVLAVFLIRQPVSIFIKTLSGRRSRDEQPGAFFWMLIHGLVGLLAVAGLLLEGYTYLLYLALPGTLVFAWHLLLVSRRQERRQIGIELIGSGVLALAAPAAYWVGKGEPDPYGWLLFGLTWFQSAASIVYAYLRLEQRVLPGTPGPAALFQMARRAIAYTTFNFLAVILLSLFKITPMLLPVPYGLQWLETLWGTWHPAVKVKPTAIGIRQLIVSTLFTLLFILTWLFSPT